MKALHIPVLPAPPGGFRRLLLLCTLHRHGSGLRALALLGGILLLLLISGCSGLRLRRSLVPADGDWPLLGRTAARTSVAGGSLVPPLTIMWKTDISGGIGKGSPVVIDTILLVGNLRGELYALNTRTGARLGWVSLGEAIEGSPALFGSCAIVALSNTPGSLVSYDLEAGKPTWRRAGGDFEASPLLLGNRIFIGNTVGTFSCIDARSGDELWSYKIPDNTSLKGFRSSPTAAGDSLVLAGCDDGILRAFSVTSGDLRWALQTGAVIEAAPIVSGGLCVVGTRTGKVIAVDAISGRLVWSAEAGPGIVSHGVPATDRFLVMTTGGLVHAFDRSTGALLWSTEMGGPLNAGGLLADSLFYAGTLKRELVAIRVSDGTIVWRTKFEGRVKSALASTRGQLYVATDDRQIIALRGNTP